MLVLKKEKRHLFQEPFGTIYPDFVDILPLIREHTLYTVGDVVTASCLRYGIIPAIAITDGKTMREPIPGDYVSSASRIQAENPPGTITKDLVSAINQALQNQPAHIFVTGEEDLAVVPLVIASPPGPLLLYGQPKEGVVVLRIDTEAIKKANYLLSYFDTESQENQRT